MKTGTHRERSKSGAHQNNGLQTPAQPPRGSRPVTSIIESQPANMRPVKIGVTLMLVAFLGWSMTRLSLGPADTAAAPAQESVTTSAAPAANMPVAPAQEGAAESLAPAANAAPAPAKEGAGESGVPAPDTAAAPAQEGEAIHEAPTAATIGAPALTVVAAMGAVELSWTAVPGVERYALFSWWDRDTGWQKIGGYDLTGTSHRHTGLVAGTTYYYQVRAVYASGGAGPWSQPVSTTMRPVVVEPKSLHTAIRNGDTELVQILLDAGADPNFIDTGQNYAQTPLSLAVRAEDESMLRILIAAGADPNLAVNPASGVGSHLTYAMSLGNTEIVQILLDAGADPNVIVDTVRTARSDRGRNRPGDGEAIEGAGVVEGLVCLFTFFFACP